MRNGIRVAKLAKPSKNILMFLLSVSVGVFGVYYSKRHIESQVEHYKKQLNKTEPMVEVVVPNRAMKRGEIIANNDLSTREIPLQYVDKHSVSNGNYTVAVGQRLDFDIDEGRPLLWAHLEGGVSPTFSGTVPTGLRAMTVRVDEINSISGFLQPKDRIDLLLSHGAAQKKQVFPIIENLNVIATGMQTMVDKAFDSGTRAFNTITVQVSPAEAKKITLSQQIGKLTAILRNPKDESVLSDESMTMAKLLNIRKPKRSLPVRLVKHSSKVAPRIEYIVGGS